MPEVVIGKSKMLWCKLDFDECMSKANYSLGSTH